MEEKKYRMEKPQLMVAQLNLDMEKNHVCLH